MPDLVRGIGAILASSWRASPRRLLISATLMLLGTVSGPLAAVCLAVTTDAAFDGRTSAAVVAAAVVALLALLNLTMEHFAHIFFFELADLHQVRTEQEIGVLAQGTVGIEQHERRDYADRMELLRRDTGAVYQGVQTVLTAFTLLAQVALTVVLLARLEPWLLTLSLFAIPPLIAGRFADRLLERAELATAEQTRLGWHLIDLAISSTAAKEIRVFGLQQELRRRQAASRQSVETRVRAAEINGTMLRLAAQLVFSVGYVGAVILVVRSAIEGRQTVGDVVLVVTLAVQTNAQAAGVVAVAQALQATSRAMAHIRWLRLAGAAMTDPVTADVAVPATLRSGVSFEDVTFNYPGTDSPVLRDLTVHIPAGTTVAIVGDNGAGKSTLVKLLCGFYRPTAGRITVDGTDLRRLDPVQWRRRITAAFQDFVRLDAPARESIGAGDLDRLSDPGAVPTAVRRADANDVIDRLPAGLDTHLGKAYEDGQELSGGQWQRIALSRAMMREDPLLLVLDEPTAALDPLTEHAIFERYAESARGVAGGMTVLVSHRFSTVRMADLILVMSDGRIAESGSHDELMAHGGIYAELFSLQAAAYH